MSIRPLAGLFRLAPRLHELCTVHTISQRSSFASHGKLSSSTGNGTGSLLIRDYIQQSLYHPVSLPVELTCAVAMRMWS